MKNILYALFCNLNKAKLGLFMGIILMSSCSSIKTLSSNTNTKYYLTGTSTNLVHNNTGTVTISLNSNDNIHYKANIQWDNIKIFGSAKLTGKIKNRVDDDTFTLTLNGTFDCSNVGGWPANTISTIDVELTIEGNSANGTYILNENGNIKLQHGIIKINSIVKI